MLRRPTTLLLALSALALPLACGGDEEGDEAEPDFRASADEVCTDSARDQLELTLAPAPPGLDGTAAQMAELAASGEETIEQLEALTPPPELAADWDRYLENRREAVEIVSERQAAAESGDADAVATAAVELAETLAARDEIGAELELEACARVLPAADEEQVREVVELASTSADKQRICEEAVAAGFLEDEFGGSVERCTRAQREVITAERVDFREIVGVEDVLATAETTITAEGETFDATTQLLYEDGAFRLFRVETQGPEQ